MRRRARSAERSYSVIALRSAAIDPLQPPKFPLSGRSPKSAISELGLYEAAVGDITLPATTGPPSIFVIAAIY
jgi:hypothetical protein